MSAYSPPYSISDRMLELVSSISEKVGRIDSPANLKSRPRLRKDNRIRSIHSSLSIEANSLSLSEVRDVIDGRIVLGDRREILEVKNAYDAYEHIPDIDTSSISDLKRIHGIMTHGLVEESGTFRKGNEGVFRGDTCIFVAPPPEIVLGLVKDLLSWLKNSQGRVHPLIASAVFHYEFVFIHPFADGNGRMARLWHTCILYRWKDIFEYIPLESQIEKFQQAYYDAISICHSNGNSNAFIEFMLEMIDRVLDDVIEQARDSSPEASDYVKRLLNCMEYNTAYTANEILALLGLRSKETLRRNYLDPAIALGLVRMTLPDKPNSRNQKYERV